MLFLPKSRSNRSIIIFIAFITVVMVLPIWMTIRIAWGAATLDYEVTPTELIISFGPSVERIEREAILSAELIEEPGRGRRVFGTNMGGLYEGRWSFDSTGRITLYATSLKPLTVIETAEQKWGITPSDPVAFLEALETGTPGNFAPPEVGTPTGIIVLLSLPVLICAGLIVMAVYLIRLSRNLAYELGTSELIIRGGRTPTRVPYKAIASVEAAEPKGVPFRAFGVSLPGLHWGAYSWRDAGPNLYLYATQLRPIVLIRTEKRTYGVTPEETERFVAELKRRVDEAQS